MRVHKYLHVCVYVCTFLHMRNHLFDRLHWFRKMLLLILFYVLRAFPLLFFFSSCFVFMPNHCHYNIGTWRLRFAYKFISAGFVIAAATQRQQQRRDVNWETEWLRHWPVSISVPVPPSLLLLPCLPFCTSHTHAHAAILEPSVLGSHFSEFCRESWRRRKRWTGTHTALTCFVIFSLELSGRILC